MKRNNQQQQLSFIKVGRTQHGGSLAVKKRRSRRPMNIQKPMHITLKSNFALGGRCLFRHKKMILSVIKKASNLFDVKVYNYAICGSHIHLLIKASSRSGVQNFFRVVSGHTAQNILKDHPLTAKELRGGARAEEANKCKKNQRKFWGYLLYSRIVTWGREFKAVYNYIDKNILELFHLIAYQRTRTASYERLLTKSNSASTA